MLRMIEDKFADDRGALWSHVILAFSKCNSDDGIWRTKLDEKEKKVREKLQKKFVHSNRIGPMITLGGMNSRVGSARLESGEPATKRPRVATEDNDRFERLWQLIQNAKPLQTPRMKLEETAAERNRS